MRDGVVLAADVYRPGGDGPWPVLLCRTPYDRTHPRYTGVARRLAAAGYLAVVQDVRGRHASGGDWTWHMDPAAAPIEAADGFESCEWAARLPGADGQVGTWGNSYPSWFIWQMAAARPPSLKAIATSGFAPHVLGCTFGIFETGIRLRWQHMMAVSSRRRAGDADWPATEEEALHNWDALLRGRHIWQLPLDGVPDALFGPDAAKQRQYWRDIHRELWALDRLHPEVAVPTLTLTGWWDRLSSLAAHFTGMRANGPAATRGAHRLVIGPWLHSVESREDWSGPRDYGPAARLDLVAEFRRFYDFHLKGIDTGIAAEKPVRLYLANDRGWSFWEDWPPPASRPVPMYLSSRVGANTPAGDGRLAFAPAAGAGQDGYVYDPADPVPSLVGADGQAEACDQRPLHARRDILVYQTPPLEAPLTLAGTPRCVLWIASDAPETDFFARLIEVGADGRAFNISHGVLRTRYLEGFDRVARLVPDAPTEIAVPMLPVGIRLQPGSRLRLDITSSDFPTFDRNHNTGAPFHSNAELRIARQRLFHGAVRPSRVILPVVADG
jgi:putative CocE/NonD family hydrolase